MGYPELAQTLRREGDEKAQKLRQAAQAQAARLQQECAERLAQMRARYARQQRLAEQAQRRTVLAEGERAATLVRLKAEQQLAARLYTVALDCLPELAGGRTGALFDGLAAELPLYDWERVRVNPADAARARELFPRASVEPDPEITQGILAFAEKGRIRIDNTLAKRLERAWPVLVPHLMDTIRHET
jgi:V/A-type H+-transporting ATPase subunit E